MAQKAEYKGPTIVILLELLYLSLNLRVVRPNDIASFYLSTPSGPTTLDFRDAGLPSFRSLMNSCEARVH